MMAHQVQFMIAKLGVEPCMLHIRMALADNEGALISDRTHAPLAQREAQSNRATLTEAQATGAATNRQEAGVRNHWAIAETLNAWPP